MVVDDQKHGIVAGPESSDNSRIEMADCKSSAFSQETRCGGTIARDAAPYRLFWVAVLYASVS